METGLGKQSLSSCLSLVVQLTLARQCWRLHTWVRRTTELCWINFCAFTGSWKLLYFRCIVFCTLCCMLLALTVVLHYWNYEILDKEFYEYSWAEQWHMRIFSSSDDWNHLNLFFTFRKKSYAEGVSSVCCLFPLPLILFQQFDRF